MKNDLSFFVFSVWLTSDFSRGGARSPPPPSAAKSLLGGRASGKDASKTLKLLLHIQLLTAESSVREPMASQIAPTGAGAAPWRELSRRVEVRLITALDLVSIMMLDAAVLAMGYAVLRATERLPHSPSSFFEIARQLSAGLFLLLYMVTVAFHFWRFLRQELNS